MKFKDLEIGQTFRWPEMDSICTKLSAGTYSSPGAKTLWVSKEARNGGRRWDVIATSEPPSMIAVAAKRDTRWYLLDNMDVTADEVRTMRERDSCGIQEAVRTIKRRNLLNGLDVLKLELDAEGNDKTERVLHDLIEIVRELV